MKTIQLLNLEIPYKIVKKRNKNTYFYFKKDGYILINLSKHQREKEILQYLHDNAHKFVEKYKHTLRPTLPEGVYMFLGEAYQKESKDSIKKIELDRTNHIVYEPSDGFDHAKLYKDFEKSEMKKQVTQLIALYKDNGHVNIEGVHYTFRAMNTRHGSCNKTKRRISLSLHLINVDLIYLEYVFLHEICHLNEANHGQGFYKLLSTLCPDYKQRKKELRKVW